MKPAPFHYQRPETLAEALTILAEDPDAKVIAGGQSLVPVMNFRLARPTTLVDISRLEDLDFIDVDKGRLCIGARVRQRAVETSDLVADSCRLLPTALRWVGHPQIRNRGTVCGSLAHGDPASELPAVAVATGAELVATGPGGQRVIPAGKFFLGPLWTELEDGEILTEVRFPVDVPGAESSVQEYARRSGDFAIAGVVVRASLDGPAMEEIAIAAFGVSTTPVRMKAIEEAILAGTNWSADLSDLVAVDVPEPTSDGQADSEYRIQLLEELLRRAITECGGHRP